MSKSELLELLKDFPEDIVLNNFSQGLLIHHNGKYLGFVKFIDKKIYLILENKTK